MKSAHIPTTRELPSLKRTNRSFLSGWLEDDPFRICGLPMFKGNISFRQCICVGYRAVTITMQSPISDHLVKFIPLRNWAWLVGCFTLRAFTTLYHSNTSMHNLLLLIIIIFCWFSLSKYYIMGSTWNPYIYILIMYIIYIFTHTVLLEQDHEQYKEDEIYVGNSVRSFGAIFDR